MVITLMKSTPFVSVERCQIWLCAMNNCSPTERLHDCFNNADILLGENIAIRHDNYTIVVCMKQRLIVESLIFFDAEVCQFEIISDRRNGIVEALDL